MPKLPTIENAKAGAGKIRRRVRWLNPLVWWRRLQRTIDYNVLGPAIRKAANSDQRKIAQCWEAHMTIDPAWTCPVWEYTERDMELMLFVAVWTTHSEPIAANIGGEVVRRADDGKNLEGTKP